MAYVLSVLALLVVGGVATLLIYHNNKAKMNQISDKLSDTVDNLTDKINK